MYIYLTWACRVSRTWYMLAGGQQLGKRDVIPQAQSWPRQCPAHCHRRWQSSGPRKLGRGWPVAGLVCGAHKCSKVMPYLSAEFFQRESLNSVDA